MVLVYLSTKALEKQCVSSVQNSHPSPWIQAEELHSPAHPALSLPSQGPLTACFVSLSVKSRDVSARFCQ